MKKIIGLAVVTLVVMTTPTNAQQTVWLSNAVAATVTADTVPPALDEIEVSSNGVNLWGTSDSAAFVLRKGIGDSDVWAFVEEFTGARSNGKAGLTVRETLAANSKHVTVNVKPNGEIEILARRENGASTVYIGGLQTAFPASPIGIRIARNEAFVDILIAENGPDSWRHLHSEMVHFPTEFYTGMVVTSGNSASRARALFGGIGIIQR